MRSQEIFYFSVFLQTLTESQNYTELEKSSSFSYDCVAAVNLTVQCFYTQGTAVMRKYN